MGRRLRVLMGITLAVSWAGCEQARESNERQGGDDGPGERLAVRSAALAATDLSWTGGEMLGQPTATSVTVKALAGQAVEAYVEYDRRRASIRA